MKYTKKNRINEATGAGASGNFKIPIVLAPEIWTEEQLEPYVLPVYKYTNAELAYEEAAGEFKESPEKRKQIEMKTKKIGALDQYLKKFYTGQNDEEGGNIADVELPEKLIKRAVGPLKEDLAVWFGTKKKPKGSKQPAGPWVNICRKDKNGKHPPCGRPEASDKGYPKCRGAAAARNMSDSQKKSACQQKRRAEKKDTQSGKGQKPVMTSYKTKKTQKESLEKIVRNILSSL